MTTFPKNTGDELPAVDWNIVAAQADDALKPSGNLAGLASASTARTNLGLGNTATLNVGTSAGTVAAGDDSRITGAAQKASNLSDLASAATARDNLGLADVAASGDYDDLTNAPTEERDGTPSLVITDADGMGVVSINDDGTEIDLPPIRELRTPGGIFSGAVTFEIVTGTDIWQVADDDGFVGGGVDANGVGYGFFGSAGSDTGGSDETLDTHTVAEIDARNGVNLGLSASMSINLDTHSARPIWKYNHVLLYGQSLSVGSEGTPPLSTSARYGTLMLGNNIQSVYSGSTNSDENWVINGPAVFRDATVTEYVNEMGEGVGPGAAAAFRRLTFQHDRAAADTNRLLVLSGAGVSARSLTQLSKGASPELFARLGDVVGQAQAAATAASGSYGIMALLFLQGENDNGASESTYATKQRALYADFLADVVDGVAGQADPPAMFTYQTPCTTSSDSANMGVQMAQLNIALADPGVYMVGPTYPYPDSNNIHLTANGYRWFGHKFGEVMYRVLILGQRWKPLHMLRATRRGREILVDFHVPVPPLAWGTPYRSTSFGGENTAQDYTNKGFSVVVSGSPLTISSVALASDTQVLITLATAPPDSAAVKVRYADGANNGTGMLRDSAPNLAEDSYEVLPDVLNLLRYSRDFSNAAWVKSGVTVSTNTDAGVDLSTAADTIVESSATAVHHIEQQTITTPTNVAHTYSQYVKASGRTVIEMAIIGNSSSNSVTARFDLSAGSSTVANAGTASGATALIRELYEDWWLVGVTGTPEDADGTTLSAVRTSLYNGALSYAGDGTSGVILGDAQLETGTTVSRRIQTSGTAGAGTRGNPEIADEIAALEDEPYPMWNWCAAAQIDVETLA